MGRPKIAFFDFACCEGCQLQIANMGEALLEVLKVVDVVEFREVMSEKWEGSLDVAVVEGSITTEHAEERIRRIRDRASLLIAYGSCACIGGVNGMKNGFDLEEIRRYVYGEKASCFDTTKVRPLEAVVAVDYQVPGCPVYPPEFIEVLKSALSGLPYHIPDKAVCTECRFNENECLFEKGVTCLGPVTRAGCNSWCPNYGNICYGCRGLVSNPNRDAFREILEKYGIPLELILRRTGMYNSCQEDLDG